MATLRKPKGRGRFLKTLCKTAFVLGIGECPPLHHKGVRAVVPVLPASERGETAVLSSVMSRGGEAGPSPQTVDTRVLWHFGLMPHDDKACVSNGDVSRVLHVDAREDRLVEIVDARITRVIPLDDLVSYSLEEEIEGEGGDDAGFFLDEAEEGMRWREKTTITLTVRNAVDKELHCVEYRVQSISETRALRAVLERLSLGGDEALADDTTTRSQHEDENKARRAGTLMRRRGRVALSERQTWSGNETAGGRWTTCAAVCVGGNLILMAKPPVGGGDDGDAGDVYTQTCEGQRRSQKTVKTVKGTARNLPAPAIATGGRAVSLSIHAVFCLENARVVKRRAKWNDGGDGEFDIVCNAGRVVLAVPRGGAAERDAWIEVSISIYHIPPTVCPYETDTFFFISRRFAKARGTPTAKRGEAFSVSATIRVSRLPFSKPEPKPEPKTERNPPTLFWTPRRARSSRRRNGWRGRFVLISGSRRTCRMGKRMSTAGTGRQGAATTVTRIREKLVTKNGTAC